MSIARTQETPPSGGETHHHPLPIRISRIAGRFLVFDAADVMFLRRKQGTVSVLVGTTPQAPSQNAFLGLPLELGPEEARALLDRGVARIVDDDVAHLQRLRGETKGLAALCGSRRHYIDALRKHQNIARRIQEERKQKQQQQQQQQQQSKRPSRRRDKPAPSNGADDSNEADGYSNEANDDSNKTGPGDLAQGEETPLPAADNEAPPDPEPEPEPAAVRQKKNSGAGQLRRAAVAVTPTTDKELMMMSPSSAEEEEAYNYCSPYSVPDPPMPSPLYNHLQASGYTMTPGIRFGVTYSVYPGDPMRFHAHFLAEEYGWDEEVGLRDLAGLGRLATSVKKGFLMGAQDRRRDRDDGGGGGDQVVTFCLEWAAM